MILTLGKEMCNTSYKDGKGMPFMNFKMVTAKNLKMEF